MKYSYFFNPDKSHRLECEVIIGNSVVRAGGETEYFVTARITEIINNAIRKQESMGATFIYPSAQEHAIDTFRIRYASQKKWIFNVRNNRNQNQSITVGIISDISNKNPLGCDIYYENGSYRLDLKANNLSVLEQTYTPPVISQTLISTGFDTPFLPDRFNTSGYVFHDNEKFIELRDFQYTYFEDVQPFNRFRMMIQIAPRTIDHNDEKIFSMHLNGIGDITFTSSELSFKNTDDEVMSVSVENIVPEKFYENGFFHLPATLDVEADGKDTVIIKYAGYELQAPYNAQNSHNQISFEASRNVFINNFSVRYYV